MLRLDLYPLAVLDSVTLCGHRVDLHEIFQLACKQRRTSPGLYAGQIVGQNTTIGQNKWIRL